MRRRVLAVVVSAVALSTAAVVIMAKNDVHCDLFYDGVWNDVTASEEVLTRDPFGIVRGRADEVATAIPDAGTFTLDNREGKYNPKNPVGELYGKFGENTPTRVHIGTPHVAAVTITDADSTSHVAPSVIAPTGSALLIGVWANPDPANSYTVPGSMTAGPGTTDARTTMKAAHESISSAGPTGTRTATVGTVEESVSASVLLHGTNPAVAGTAGFSVVVVDPTTVAGQWWVVASYFGWDDTEATATPDFPSDTDGGGWLLLADSGTDTWSDAQADFARMKVWAKRIKTGGSHTVRVDNPTGDLDSIQSVLYRVSGVTGWFPRMHGEAGSFKPGREIKGPAWVNVGAYGPSMRLTQGEPPKDSAHTRAVLGSAVEPLAYWPLEDAATATRAASPIAGVEPMHPITEVLHTLPNGEDIPPGGAPVFGSGIGPAGSAPLASLSNGGTLLGLIPQAVDSTQWSFEFVVKWEPGTTLASEDIQIILADGTYGAFIVNSSTDGIDIFHAVDRNASLSGSASAPFSPSDGAPRHIRYTVAQDGANYRAKLYVNGTLTDTADNFGSAMAGTVGQPRRIEVNPLSEKSGSLLPSAIGQIIFWKTETVPVDTVTAAFGHVEEKAGRRFLRLCREENLTAAVAGDPDDTQPMGPQPADTVAAQLAEIETTDDALIGDAREFLGLRMRTGRSMAAQQPVLELDFAQFHIAPPLNPVIDDQGARNDITVKRRSGGEAHAVQETGPRNVQAPTDDPQGVGRYRHTVNVNTATDGVLDNHASWHRHKGTIDEIRWPTVTIDLLATPELADAVSAADSGDLITIDNLPDDYQAHQARLLVSGYAETIHTHQRFVTFNCVPASTRDVGAYGPADTVSRYDSANSTLVTGVAAGVTTLSVATEAGHALWITTAALPTHFPFDVKCAGIRLTVTAISGSSSPQTFTVLRNVDGIDGALSAGAQVRLWRPARFGL